MTISTTCNHMGFRCKAMSRNTRANANEQRHWKIYADFAQLSIGRAIEHSLCTMLQVFSVSAYEKTRI